VKLIFDENLSPTLPHRLSEPFPDTIHVEMLGFKGRDDLCIWEHTKQIEGAIIVSKDDDFRELALADGPPPKVIALQNRKLQHSANRDPASTTPLADRRVLQQCRISSPRAFLALLPQVSPLSMWF